MAARARGAMIVFEGCDRCGKTTQCSRLLKYFKSQGKDVQIFRFPDRTTAIGKTINSYLQEGYELDDHAIHLMFSANRWEMRSKMKRLLEAGTTLIVDRYAFSGVAFTAAKDNFDLDWCKVPDSGLLAPDLVVYLDMPVEKAAERGEYGGERYEKIEFQRKVANIYLQLRENNWKVLDASQTADKVEQDVRQIVERTMNAPKTNELQILWPLIKGTHL